MVPSIRFENQIWSCDIKHGPVIVIAMKPSYLPIINLEMKPTCKQQKCKAMQFYIETFFKSVLLQTTFKRKVKNNQAPLYGW